MQNNYWLRQSLDKPLFPDLLWSRPENRQAAGKLLIIGGHAQSFAAVAEAYNEALKAGIGTARVLLPDILQKTVGKIFPEAEFALSAPAGSFSQKSLDEFLSLSMWADGVLIAGDLGRNSETAILLEKFLNKFSGHVTLTKDAADYFPAGPATVLDRPNTTLVISFAQLQKLAAASKFGKAFTFNLDIVRLVETLHDFSALHPAAIITKHLENIFVAASGQVSSTKLKNDAEIWRVQTAAQASVWQLQNPSKPFEALTAAVYEFAKN